MDIYAVLIKKWIEREVAYLKDKSNEQKESLYIFSSEIALKIYDNWKNESRMFINAEEFDELKSINKIQQEHPYQYNKVKVIVKFFGREMAHTELGAQLLERFAAGCEDNAVIEKPALLDGRNMIMILAPKKTK